MTNKNTADTAAAVGHAPSQSIASELIERTRPFIPDLSNGVVRPKDRPWQTWLDAKLGLRD